jgi:hypothetical protein
LHDFFLDDQAQFIGLFRGFLFKNGAGGQDVTKKTEVSHQDMFIKIVAVVVKFS